MMELVLFGIILTVSMVVASLLVFVITMKVMFSKRYWKKITKHYMEIVKEITEEMEGLNL